MLFLPPYLFWFNFKEEGNRFDRNSNQKQGPCSTKPDWKVKNSVWSWVFLTKLVQLLLHWRWNSSRFYRGSECLVSDQTPRSGPLSWNRNRNKSSQASKITINRVHFMEYPSELSRFLCAFPSIFQDAFPAYVVFPSEFFDHPLSQMRLKAEYYLEKSQCRLDAPLSPLTEGGLTFFLFFLQQQCFSKLLCVTRGSKTSLWLCHYMNSPCICY